MPTNDPKRTDPRERRELEELVQDLDNPPATRRPGDNEAAIPSSDKAASEVADRNIDAPDDSVREREPRRSAE
jgi:hypothetical protein